MSGTEVTGSLAEPVNDGGHNRKAVRSPSPGVDTISPHRALPHTTSKPTMLPSTVRAAWVPFLNSPNKVLQKQRIFQDRFNHHVPTHLIAPGSGLIYGTYVTFWGVGLVGTAFMAYQMIMGKKTTAD
ncbi:hypothetical protein DACRYDRAFT_103154 [Dacryopinax primogenitus]|uniref:Uncharacterized protein n=1 Tax=Dacryopinax primogenitus (strain DJM 731) TaxID=1858805 RepID=M5GBA6_DACPD|nr:uncharacterized protein DACRYDRAFT_103154 [Dacryopinax primogenitus]EJU06209.1 hypothetical protein DACRYDRAFT_103154 [Dacryopinax primogenitus]